MGSWLVSRMILGTGGLALVLLVGAAPATSQPQGPSRPLWLTHTFGVPSADEGLALAGIVNAHTSNGVTFVCDSSSTPSYVALSADSTRWSGVQHDLFLALDTDHDDAGTLRLGFRTAPADTHLSFVEAVNVAVGNDGDRHVFHVDLLCPADD